MKRAEHANNSLVLPLDINKIADTNITHVARSTRLPKVLDVFQSHLET